MVRQTITKLIDDIDGTPADSTVTFALDGERFEIDLSDANAAKLRESFAPWVAGARPVRGGGARRSGGAARSGAPRRSRSQSASEAQAIREWARENDIEVSDRGRIKAEIVEQYNNR
ncbi:histone-like nucleoid-structuring protein Lsr2 [Georgenia sp. Z1344]|uniref:histone-like nucleoid-structuring protein Lsr2 n=1 Tax=Georgenia sp. Z1344 TaxID=3416706 RepID=UPI003CF963ED